MLKGVGFDFGNVIGIFNTSEWLEFVKHHRGNCRRPEEMFSGDMLQVILAFDRGGMSDVEFYSRIRTAYRMSIPTLRDFYDKLGKILSIDWEMVGLVQNLRKRGVATFLVTNINSFHARYIRQNFPEVFPSFDYCMISCEEGIIKPEPEAYIRPLEILGLKSEDCIFIDDSWSNIKAACRLGYKGWHFNSTDNIFLQNGKINEEREKLINLISVLDEQGLLYDKTRH